MLPDVAPVLGRSNAAVAASLASPAVPAPLVVAGQATATMLGHEQPDVAVVVSKWVAQSAPLVAIETAPDVDRAKLDAATVVSEGAAQSTPPEVQMEEAAAASGPAGADAAVVASEVDRTGEDTAGGSPGILAVVGRTRRPSPPALLSGATIPLRRASRRSIGWMLGIRRRLCSRLMMLPIVRSGRTLTLGSRP